MASSETLFLRHQVGTVLQHVGTFIAGMIIGTHAQSSSLRGPPCLPASAAGRFAAFTVLPC